MRLQIAQNILAGPGPAGLEAHQQLLFELTVHKDDLEGELARQIPEMNVEQKLRAVDRQVIAKALPADSALVEVVRCNIYDFTAVLSKGDPQWKPAHYVVFILLARSPDKVCMVDLGDARQIDGLIEEFRNEIAGDEPTLKLVEIQADMRSKRKMSELLRQSVFDPWLAALGACRRLFLSPDGDLTRLPFETLPLNKRRFLIDDYQISYLSVGRDVLRFGTPAGQPADPLILADPDFNLEGQPETPPLGPSVSTGHVSRDLDRESLRFLRLPGTRQEGEQIASLLGILPWLRGDVLEARLKSRSSPRILHLYWMDFSWRIKRILLINPLAQERNSRICLDGYRMPVKALCCARGWRSPAPMPVEEKPLHPEAEDGILNAEDVTGLILLDTELVVLSACETGLGKVQIGEGVFGLRRSFVLAGAHTLVMSLWKVPDQQTQELMVDLLVSSEGKPRAEALRKRSWQ